MVKLYIILLILISNSFSGFHTYLNKNDINAYEYNETIERYIVADFYIKYSPEVKLPTFCIKNTFTRYEFTFDEQTLNEFTNAIDKFLEWNNKAIQMGVELNKLITTVSPLIGFIYLDEDSYLARQTEIELYIDKTKYFNIYFKKITTNSSEYITSEPEQLFITVEDVKKLRKALTRKAFDKFETKIKKQKEISEQFK